MFFNPEGAIAKTQNRLPHWEQSGGCYFITFRLADSIPAQLLRQWESDLELWMIEHPKPWTKDIEDEYHRLFSVRIENWLDEGFGDCALRSMEVREKVLARFSALEEKSLVCHSMVIMPNHVHALATFRESSKLGDVLQLIKGGSSKRMNEVLKRTGRFWQKDYFDRLVRHHRHFYNCLKYIRNNPSKARLDSDEYSLQESAMAKQLLNV